MTLPVNPRLGVIVIIAVAAPPAAMVTGVLVSVKLGPGVTVTGTVTPTGEPELAPFMAVPSTVTE